MNLHMLLAERVEAGRPIRAGLIGAGKFGMMFLSQVPSIPGIRAAMIADLSVERARQACRSAGWDEALVAATRFTDQGRDICLADDIEVVIEATGSPAAGIEHAVLAIGNGKHVVMVNVEADALAGPALAARAKRAGTVYSLAYGDQPALISELVDWARAAGFFVQAAGKGTKYLPAYHEVTPDGVWEHYGLTPGEAADAGMNSRMFNSFLDGTKSAIEMVAVANACGLDVPESGLAFPPCGVDDLSRTLSPRDAGGLVEGRGMVEVVSSLERDGRPVFRDLRWGVYVVIEAHNAYAARCFRQYGLPVDPTGRYTAMYKPFHLIGLELSISVLSASLRGEPTGQPRSFRGDAVAVAKRDLNSGDTLDGEGGYTVWGKASPAARSIARKALPIGLAHGLKVLRPVARGHVLSMDDVEPVPEGPVLAMRRETEKMAAGQA